MSPTNQPTGRVPHNRGCGEIVAAALVAIALVITWLWAG